LFHRYKQMLKMVRWLNNILLSVFILTSVSAAAQSMGAGSANSTDYSDYKDADQHERFLKRRKIVGAWQINQLKKGAIVVRLKTNSMAISGLRAQGKTREADLLEAETFVINKNTVYAWLEHFNFCKVYFINSSASDSLLRGQRSGLFLDTNLRIDPSITMTESFYLIAERDFAYNSSIGFVTEAQAKTIVEKGNPSKPMAFVLKNKYGHQLKNPIPHEVAERSTATGFYLPVNLRRQQNGLEINYLVNRNPTDQLEKSESATSRRAEIPTEVAIAKQFTYFKLAQFVSQLNADLKAYYQRTPEPGADRIPEDVKPFLY